MHTRYRVGVVTSAGAYVLGVVVGSLLFPPVLLAQMLLPLGLATALLVVLDGGAIPAERGWGRRVRYAYAVPAALFPPVAFLYLLHRRVALG